MSGATTVRRTLRLALVSFGVAAAVAGSTATAFADGTPAAGPSVSAPATGVKPAPAVSTPAADVPCVQGVRPSVQPSGAPAVQPSCLPKPSAAPASSGSGAQVVVVPKGGAQTGEGTTGQSSTVQLAGAGLAAAGVAAIGFAVVRRRAGARG